MSVRAALMIIQLYFACSRLPSGHQQTTTPTNGDRGQFFAPIFLQERQGIASVPGGSVYVHVVGCVLAYSVQQVQCLAMTVLHGTSLGCVP